MIKIVKAEHTENKVIRLVFSDQSWGAYDFPPLIERQTELVFPPREDNYFRGFFLELGALCWKNDLEFSAGSLNRKLPEQGKLHTHQQAA